MPLLPFKDAVWGWVGWKEHWAGSQETWVLIPTLALTVQVSKRRTLQIPFTLWAFLSSPIFEKGEVDEVPSCSGRFEVNPSPSFSLPWLAGWQEEVGTEVNGGKRDPFSTGLSSGTSYALPETQLRLDVNRPYPLLGLRKGWLG